MEYMASELIGWGMLGLFNLVYFGTAVYGIHDMFFGKVDFSDKDESVTISSQCPFSGTKEYKRALKERKKQSFE